MNEKTGHGDYRTTNDERQGVVGRPALVFMDTETTGLALDDDIWEFAAIRREPDGTESRTHLFIEHDTRRCAELPESFRYDHDRRWPGDHAPFSANELVREYVYSRSYAARIIARLFADRPHVVGAVPNFDTERLALMLRRHGHEPGWHYHLIDVENLAVGYLAGRAVHEGYTPVPLPWDSDDLSARCGIDPPTTERHTAMGDAEWAMRLYDAITGHSAGAEAS